MIDHYFIISHTCVIKLDLWRCKCTYLCNVTMTVLTVMARNCGYESEKALLRYSSIISTRELIVQVLNHPES